MSMNQYMHPRNIYKSPPNFKELAIKYSEFREYVKQDICGKVILDFKDVNALRALSRALLLKDFDLNVEMPVNKLIPTIPLRLNYLLWIEDLLAIQNVNFEEIHGIDIGTGASCVYPLMAAKKFKWKMIGTDIDEDSLCYAKKNVSENLLEDFIQVLKVTGDTLLKDVLIDTTQVFNFSMCNPPFFSSTQELHPFFKSRKLNRPHPKNAFCASLNEVVINGGEIEFISRLIRESITFKDRIKIFTSMVGHKSSLAPLKLLLREVEVCSFKQTEFCQGHTTRWGLAWTFQDIDLRTIPITVKKNKCKQKAPLIHLVPNLNKSDIPYTMEHINGIIIKIIDELKFKILEIKKTKSSIIYEIISYVNTWSNQRRKRREKLYEKKIELEVSIPCNTNEEISRDSGNSSLQSDDTVDAPLHEKNIEVHDTSKQFSEMEISSVIHKREHESDDEYYHIKRIKSDGEKIDYLAKFFLVIRKHNTDLQIELLSLDIDTNRETMHQILQYIKNNLK